MGKIGKCTFANTLYMYMYVLAWSASTIFTLTYFDIKTESILKNKFYKYMYIYLQIKILALVHKNWTVTLYIITCKSVIKFYCSQ